MKINNLDTSIWPKNITKLDFDGREEIIIWGYVCVKHKHVVFHLVLAKMGDTGCKLVRIWTDDDPGSWQSGQRGFLWFLSIPP